MPNEEELPEEELPPAVNPGQRAPNDVSAHVANLKTELERMAVPRGVLFVDKAIAYKNTRSLTTLIELCSLISNQTSQLKLATLLVETNPTYFGGTQ